MSEKKQKTKHFIEKAIKIHGDRFDYDYVLYKNSKEKVLIKCNFCKVCFYQAPNSHLAGYGCKKCANNALKHTKKQFIDAAKKVHGELYDYSETKYSGSNIKIEIKCNKCKTYFWQLPSNHLSGRGCKECNGGVNPSTTEAFIEQAKKIHCDRYSYELTFYKNKRTKVIIICSEHGQFSQMPYDHLKGGNCRKCAGQFPYNNFSFIEKANIVHNNKYTYEYLDYKNKRTKVIITCNTHGNFSQRADSHMSGVGCPKCSPSISKPETKWLDSLNINHSFRNKKIKVANHNYKVDAYDPTTNTIYEFNGDYWHGNPKVFDQSDINKNNKRTFGELYRDTINREELLINAGYKLIIIWENEWKTLQKKGNK